MVANHNAQETVSDGVRASASAALPSSGADRLRATNVDDSREHNGRRSETADDRDGFFSPD